MKTSNLDPQSFSNLPGDLLIKLTSLAVLLISKEVAQSGKSATEIAATAGQTLSTAESKLIEDLTRLVMENAAPSARELSKQEA